MRLTLESALNIEISELRAQDALTVTDLFTAAFAASEGESEGAVIAKLVSELIQSIDSPDVSCYVAVQQDRLIGAVFTTTLRFDQDLHVQMLAPVAVATAFQGQGVGQQMIRGVIQMLAHQGVDTLVTYGDPAYYDKVGFAPLDEREVPAPMPLSMPIGWLGQTLNRTRPPELTNPICVAPFRDPVYW